MFKKASFALIAGWMVLGAAGSARAQFLDMSQMVQNELNFQNQFYNWAWKGSVDLAKQIPNDQPLPFNAMTLFHANNQAAQAWNGYIQNSQYNSQINSNAINNWTNGAINGVAPYVNSQGNGYLLPYTHNNYHVGPYGYIVPGYQQGGTNFYPY